MNVKHSNKQQRKTSNRGSYMRNIRTNHRCSAKDDIFRYRKAYTEDIFALKATQQCMDVENEILSFPENSLFYTIMSNAQYAAINNLEVCCNNIESLFPYFSCINSTIELFVNHEESGVDEQDTIMQGIFFYYFINLTKNQLDIVYNAILTLVEQNGIEGIDFDNLYEHINNYFSTDLSTNTSLADIYAAVLGLYI